MVTLLKLWITNSYSSSAHLTREKVTHHLDLGIWIVIGCFCLRPDKHTLFLTV